MLLISVPTGGLSRVLPEQGCASYARIRGLRAGADLRVLALLRLGSRVPSC